MAAVLIRRFTQMREDVYFRNQVWPTEISIGGVITSILLAAYVPITEPPIFHELLDEVSLNNSLFLRGRVNGNLLYQFHLEKTRT